MRGDKELETILEEMTANNFQKLMKDIKVTDLTTQNWIHKS